MNEKQEIRKQIRHEKASHDEAELVKLSDNICQNLLKHPKIGKAHTLLLYWALPDEVRSEKLILALVSMGKEVMLPKVVSDTDITIHRFTSVNDLQKGAYGIMEPIGETISIETLSEKAVRAKASGNNVVAIVPGMAFDEQGHRLGRGKGYYDRFLAKVPSLYKIGVCFPFQVLPHIPHNEYDMLMNEVVFQ